VAVSIALTAWSRRARPGELFDRFVVWSGAAVVGGAGLSACSVRTWRTGCPSHA